MERKEFIKTLGIGLAGLTLNPVRVLAGGGKEDKKNGYLKIPDIVLDQEAKVDKHVTVVVIGAGARGRTYAAYALRYPKALKVVGVADILQERKENMAKQFGIPEKYRFGDWQEVFRIPKFADAVVIATPDPLHFAPCMKALEQGYDVLLEKPIAQSTRECQQILTQAKKYDRLVGVCHVLRYAPYFIALRKTLQSGAIGDIVSIQHMERIRFHHMAHSYVRGNWKNSTETTPIVVAKSCHDMDMIRWLVDKPCKSVAAYGDLYLFRKENAPRLATQRCLDCPVEAECAFSAKRIYLEQRRYLYVFDIPDEDRNNPKHKDLILEKLRTTDYGRCVYRSGSDQCDHLVAAMEFEGKVTASFSMEAFTAEGGRLIRVMGTKGYVDGDMKSFMVTDFLTGQKSVWAQDISSLPGYEGHAGGDFGIVKDFVLAVANRDPKRLSSTIDLSVESHIMGFEAERSRIENKKIEL